MTEHEQNPSVAAANECDPIPNLHRPSRRKSMKLEDDSHDAKPASATKQSKPKHISRSSITIRRLLRAGRIEENGIHPLAEEERTQKRFFNIFTIWLSINSNILGITFGMLGPLVYSLSLRDSALVILFFNLLATTTAGILATFGPKTGMRQMIHARYSFGRYLVSVPVLLNLATLTGFNAVICVVGGQCLSAISSGSISPTAGIVVIALLSLAVSFAGFRILHIFETYSFIPALISIIIATGVGGKGLGKQTEPEEPATVANVLSFGMIIAGYQIPWACIASDLTTYFDPNVPNWRVFHYTYWGLLIPTVLLMTLGAAIAGALPQNPEWEHGNEVYGVGGVLAAMLSSAGGFGKFVVVLQALSLLGNTCGSFYAITLNFQALIPILFKVPRYVFSVLITAAIIPVAIYAYRDFYTSLSNFISLIAYWSAAFVGIIIADHTIIRGCRFDSYDPKIWANAEKLPMGIAALASGVISFGLIIPCMTGEWFVGPIAEKTGDIGFEVAFVLRTRHHLFFCAAFIRSASLSNPRTKPKHKDFPRLSGVSERFLSVSSWTPPPPQSPQLFDRPWGSSGPSSQRFQSLLDSYQDQWWPVSETHHCCSEDRNSLDVAAAATTATTATASTASSIIKPTSTNTHTTTTTSDCSPLETCESWPFSLDEEEFLFDQSDNYPNLALPSTVASSVSPGELALDLSSFIHPEKEQHYDSTPQNHCQELLNLSLPCDTPFFSTFDGPDKTYLSLLGCVGSANGLGSKHESCRHRSPQRYDMFTPGDQNLNLGTHTFCHHVTTSLRHATNNSVNDNLLSTPSTASSSVLSRTATPAHSGEARQRSVSSSNIALKRKQTASPPEHTDPDSEEAQVAIKRQRNTMAARKYRQKRLDRISDLEQALGEVTEERDELKLKLARREAEVEALREMLARK